MQIIIPDAVLKDAGLTPKDVLVELACRLFDIGRIGLSEGGRIVGVSRIEFERFLRERGIAAYRVTEADVDADLRTLRSLGMLQ